MKRRPRPEEVLAGRVVIRPDELFDLVRAVNPTDRGLPPEETERRYEQKARLASLLLSRFPDAVEILADSGDPRIVLLRRRGRHDLAFHIAIDALDDDARSQVRRAQDEGDDDPVEVNFVPGSTLSSRLSAPAHGRGPLGEIAAAAKARAAFDYDLARETLERALEIDPDHEGAAIALLSLLVEELGDDPAALAVASGLRQRVSASPRVRALVSLAAARLGQERAALRSLRGLPDQHARAAILAVARSALARSDEAAARDALLHLDPDTRSLPELREMAEAIRRARKDKDAPDEAAIEVLSTRGEIAAAAERARVLLASSPENAVARRAIRSAVRMGAEAEGRGLVAEAQAALAEGALDNALALFSRAGSLVPEAERHVLERRTSELRVLVRSRAESRLVDDVVRSLACAEQGPGLVAYCDLDDALRAAVRGHAPGLAVEWVEALRAGASPARVVAAALALARAESLAVDEAAVLRELEPHRSLIEGSDAGHAFLSTLRGRHDAAHRERVRRVLADAREDLSRARVERARGQLADLRNLTAREKKEVAEIRSALGRVARVSDVITHPDPKRKWRDADITTTCRECGAIQRMSAAAARVEREGTTYACAVCGTRFLTVTRVPTGFDMNVAGEVELRTGD